MSTRTPDHRLIQPASRNALEKMRSFGVSFREFLREPSAVGSAFPASHWMIQKMFRHLPWHEIDVFVEYGPGTGRFTKEALARLGPKATLVAIDTSADFARNLRRQTRDVRLYAVEGAAQDVRAILADRGFNRVDCILSGLPFSTLPPKEGEAIMDASCELLSQDGRFLAYQMREAVKPLLEQRFFDVEHHYEWRNMPPCHLYTASRPRTLKRKI